MNGSKEDEIALTTKTKRAIAIGSGVAVLAGGAFFLLKNKDGLAGVPGLGALADDPKCPLNGKEPAKESSLERPAVALKIENNAAAYPLSGLEDAEVVYEEPVEGGLSRFMAIYHCNDSAQAGPVRSSRVVDPAIMSPYTMILGAAGGNDIVRDALDEAGVVLIDENNAGDAMVRVPREGVSLEHTLYGNTARIRKLGREDYDELPRDDIFKFGDAEGKSKKAGSITVTFSPGNVVTFDWDGEVYGRSDNGAPLMSSDGEQFTADNVIVEEHTVNFVDGLSDILGTPSPEIADVTGSGRAVLFRDGRAYVGQWVRESEEDPVRFETKEGEEMILKAGRTWIELVPDADGELKGSFSYAK